MELHRVLNFLQNLEENNSKKWMDDYRVYYEEARYIFKSLINQMIEKISHFDDSISSVVVEDCLYRINRNQRFYKGLPYKTYFSAEISPEGRHSDYAGYYLHIEPNNQSFIGAGIYRPNSEVLNKLRMAIVEKGQDLELILNKPLFKRSFQTFTEHKLKRLPKGFEECEDSLDLIKNRDFVVYRPLKDHEIFNPNFLSNLIEYCYYLKGYNAFFNKVIIEYKKEEHLV